MSVINRDDFYNKFPVFIGGMSVTKQINDCNLIFWYGVVIFEIKNLLNPKHCSLHICKHAHLPFQV